MANLRRTVCPCFLQNNLSREKKGESKRRSTGLRNIAVHNTGQTEVAHLTSGAASKDALQMAVMNRSLKAFGAVKICSCSMLSASWCRCSAVLARTMLQLWLKKGRDTCKEIKVKELFQSSNFGLLCPEQRRESGATSSPTSFRSSTTHLGHARGCSVAP